MNKKHSKKWIGLICLLFLLCGCSTWDKLIERNHHNMPYDEFKEMTEAEIIAFNKDPANDDKIICKEETPTGSNIPQRICRWESVMKRRTEQDQKAISDMQQRMP